MTVVLDGVFCKCDATPDMAVSIDTTTWFWGGHFFYPLGEHVTVTLSSVIDVTFAGITQTYTPAQMGVQQLVDNLGGHFVVLTNHTPDIAGLFEIGVICDVSAAVPEPATWLTFLLGAAILALWSWANRPPNAHRSPLVRFWPRALPDLAGASANA